MQVRIQPVEAEALRFNSLTGLSKLIIAFERRRTPMEIRVQGIDSGVVGRIWSGGHDANGQPALRRVAEGLGNPCRHCLELIAEGDEKLVLSYRPFAAPQPYAESGPIFLHADRCDHYESDSLPSWFEYLDPAIIRGYGSDHRTRYETGEVVAGRELRSKCEQILSDPAIAYVHIRSKYNCFQCQVDRA
jgi:hypothetical protein